MVRLFRHLFENEGQAHGFKELGDELRPIVRQDGDREAIRDNLIVDGGFCDCWGGDVRQRCHLGQLLKAVRDDRYISRAVFCRRERTEEVHCYVLQRLGSREKLH